MRLILKNFRIVDEETDKNGTLIIGNGFITEIFSDNSLLPEEGNAAMIIDGRRLSSSNELPLLMPAFVDLHAHFRDPGLSSQENAPLPAEMLESAAIAAAAGGFGTVVCMANTKPPIDTIEKAAALKRRSGILGLIDLYPVLSLSKNMEGKELSEIKGISPNGGYLPLMLSEDGKDLADDGLFLAAMNEAKRLGIPISCHCDLGGDEDSAVRRVIELGKKAGCHIHIAHVSTKEAVETIHRNKIPMTKQEISPEQGSDNSISKTGFTLSCEVMPHNICLTEEDAKRLGEKTWGRVNPPLRSEEDRQALIQALIDGAIDAIATDHAPHAMADKEAGAPGFSGFETAFAAVYTELIRSGAGFDLKRLSSLMSARPANLLGLDYGPEARGRLIAGHRADLVIIDPATEWTVDPALFKSHGKNSPFIGQQLYGKVLMTLHEGRVVFSIR